MWQKIDLTGQRFNRLLVLSDAGRDKHGGVMWLCECTCGKVKEVRSNVLRKGTTQSCGCLHREKSRERIGQLTKRNIIHGDSTARGKYARLYRIWAGMKTRCLNPKNPSYRYYGNRGIGICAEWLKSYVAFKQWSLSHGYADSLSIDRIKNKSGYNPSNCQWIRRSENARKSQAERKEVELRA